MSAPRIRQDLHNECRTNDHDTHKTVPDISLIPWSPGTSSISAPTTNIENGASYANAACDRTNTAPIAGTAATLGNGASEAPPSLSESARRPADADAEAAVTPTAQPRYSTFTTWEKRAIVLAAAVMALFSPLSAQIYFPVLNTLAADFHVSAAQINLTVTTYMIFQGVVPMFVGSFADACGRRPAYLVCFVIYLAANVGLALAPSYASLLVLRCLQSAGSSSTVALCSAIVADIVTSAERGQYIGITAVPAILAPSIGPVLGGVLASRLGWRSIFWFLTISGAVTLIALLAFFPETCRRLVGDGSLVLHPAYRTLWQLAGDARRRHHRHSKRRAKEVKAKDENEEWRASRSPSRQDDADGDSLGHALTQTATSRSQPAPSLHVTLPNPFGSLLLLTSPLLFFLLFYSSIVFAGFYAIATALPVQFASAYGFGPLRIGLSYLPMAGGSVVAAFGVGPLMNKNYARHCRRLGIPYDRTRQQDLSNFPIERARLEVGAPLLLLSAAGTAGWGWALQGPHAAHVAVPYVLLFIQGAALIGFNNTASALLVDVNPGKAGTATAANNLTRCLVGAGASAAIVPLIETVGDGWAFTLVGALYIAFSPLLWLVVRNGMRWRQRAREREEREQAREQDWEDTEAHQEVPRAAESAAEREQAEDCNAVVEKQR